MKTAIILKQLTACLLFTSIAASVYSQPVFTNSVVPNYHFVITYNTVIKDQDNWLLYVYASDSFPINYNWHLLKTSDGGNTYSDITSFPAGVRKFLSVGDTVFAVGTQLSRSVDFGSTWITAAPPSPAEEYDDIILLPGNILWISGAKSTSSNYYQTDFNFSSFTPKLSLPTNGQWFNFKKHLSAFSADTLYFVKTNGNMGFEIHKTFDNGNTWTSQNLPIDSIYFALGDTSSVLTGIYRIPYIKYFNASQALIFTWASGFPKDMVTDDAFNTISYLPGLSMGHMSHEPVNWITCGQNHFLVYDAHEDSNPGLQEITYTLPGTFNLNSFYFGFTTHLSHAGDVALGGGSSNIATLVTNLCSPTSVHTVLSSENNISVFPNPVSDYLAVTSDLKDSFLQVFDVMGNEVLKQECFLRTRTQRVNVQHLPKGIYIVRVTGLNRNYTAKFVKE